MTRLRPLLEAETRRLREKVLAAERWAAKWAAEAVFFEDIVRSQALLAFWRDVWDKHAAACDWFAEYAARVIAAEAAGVRDLLSLRI